MYFNVSMQMEPCAALPQFAPVGAFDARCRSPRLARATFSVDPVSQVDHAVAEPALIQQLQLKAESGR